MEAKAQRTLRAALLLLDKGFVADAASRLYFAAFQAAVLGLERQGWKPSDFRPGATYWEHRTVVNQAWRVRDHRRDVSLLSALGALRRRADYRGLPVERRELESFRHEVVRFVNAGSA
jgi:uncharacterized protein (UPF0332 family)